MTKNHFAAALLTITATACSSKIAGLKNGDEQGRGSGGLELQIVGSPKIGLGLGKVAELQTLLTLSGQAVAGAQVRYTISGDGQGAILGTNDFLTDDNGVASARLIAGQKKASFRVIAQAEGPAPVTFDIEVDGKYLGNLVVRTGYSGQVRIASLALRLHDARSTACSGLNFEALPASIDQKTQANVNADTRFSDLQDKQKLVVSVVAMSAAGRAVATGCAATEVVGQRDTIVNITLDQKGPSVVGKYEFGQTIEPLGFMDQNTRLWVALKDITGFLTNPADMLLNNFWTLNDDGVSTRGGLCLLLTDTTLSSMCSAIGLGVLNSAIDAGLAADDSGRALQIRDILADGAAMLTQIRVGGGLDIKTFDPATGAFAGELTWDSYNLIWRNGCDSSMDPCCGHEIFDGGTLGLAIMRAPVTGHAIKKAGGTGGEIAYDLTIDEAAIGLAYGKLMATLIENVIFPKVLSARFDPNHDGRFTMGEFFTNILDCSKQPNTTAKSICEQAATAIGDYLRDGVLGQLSFSGTPDWNIGQSATGLLVDTDLDLQADQITGLIAMHVKAAGAAVNAPTEQDFDGRYVGKECSGDTNPDPAKGCALGLACRFARDPVDSCFAQNFCGASEGPKVGSDPCTSDSECFSGLCMQPVPAMYTFAYPNKCFQACAEDVDCGTNGHCDQHGYLSVEDRGSAGKSPTDDATLTGTCVR